MKQYGNSRVSFLNVVLLNWGKGDVVFVQSLVIAGKRDGEFACFVLRGLTTEHNLPIRDRQRAQGNTLIDVCTLAKHATNCGAHTMSM